MTVVEPKSKPLKCSEPRALILLTATLSNIQSCVSYVIVQSITVMKSRCYHLPFILPGLQKGDIVWFTGLNYIVCCPPYDKTAPRKMPLGNSSLMDESKTVFFHKWGAKLMWQAVTTHLTHWEGTDINISGCSHALLKNMLCLSSDSL